jgi:hypothetical protein
MIHKILSIQGSGFRVPQDLVDSGFRVQGLGCFTRCWSVQDLGLRVEV